MGELILIDYVSNSQQTLPSQWVMGLRSQKVTTWQRLAIAKNDLHIVKTRTKKTLMIMLTKDNSF